MKSKLIILIPAKPCPLCGKSDKNLRFIKDCPQDGDSVFGCHDCDLWLTVPRGKTRRQALEKWNIRRRLTVR